MGVSGSFSLFRVDGGSDEPVLSDVAVNGDLLVNGLKLTTGFMTLSFDSGSGSLELRSMDAKSF